MPGMTSEVAYNRRWLWRMGVCLPGRTGPLDGQMFDAARLLHRLCCRNRSPKHLALHSAVPRSAHDLPKGMFDAYQSGHAHRGG